MNGLDKGAPIREPLWYCMVSNIFYLAKIIVLFIVVIAIIEMVMSKNRLYIDH